MTSYRSSLWIPLFAAIALASACQSDEAEVPGGVAGGGTGGAAVHAGSGGTSHADSGGMGGREVPEGGRAGAHSGGGAPVGAAGRAQVDPGGAAGDAGRDGSAGDAASAGSAGSAGDSGDPDLARQRFAYVATFLNGLSPVSIDPVTGKLSKLSVSPINPGAQLYAVSVDPTQRYLYTAEQSTKKINGYAIATDGTLPAQPTSTTTIAGRPTSLTLEARGHFAYVASSDDDKSIYGFEIDAVSGGLTAIGTPLVLAEASPAYLVSDPSGRFLYATLNGVFGIRGYQIDQATGALSELQGSPFALGEVMSGALVFQPTGAFLFSSGNGLNAYAVDAASGALTRVEGSPFSSQVSSDPSASNLALEPGGKYLYATSFLNPPRVFGFAIDAHSGKLTAVPGEPIKGASPYSVAVEPSGRFVFAGNDDGTTSVFSLQSSNGTLHEIEGSPFPIGGLQPEFAFATAR